ncbi:MAG: hypothetical protein HQM10_10660 [Candidatus Riflebacteria bacterium]|nr:hypothetical protein [Candidatus Riflebacteria bacterium]
MELINDEIKSLSASIKSFRVLAIEKARDTWASSELLNILCERKHAETDEECQMLLSEAIAAVEARLSSDLPKSHAEDNPSDFNEQFLKSNSSDKIFLLNSLSAEKISIFSELVPQWFESESNPAVMAVLIRKFGHCWPSEKRKVLSQCLFSRFLSVRISALEIFVAHYPELLLEHLPKLLSSEDPRVRTLAIQGLARTDIDNAIEHLDSMLAGGDSREKLCALRNCYFLPFDKIKSLILKFLASDPPSDLMQKAGLLLEINADIEIPFRLIEIFDSSRQESVEILKKILNGAVKAINLSGILGDQYPQYIQRLQDFGKRYSARRFVQNHLGRINSGSTEPEIAEVFSNLSEHAGRLEIRDALKDSLNWNIFPSLKERILNFLLQNDSSAAANIDESLRKYSISGFSEEEAIKIVSSWRIEDRENVKNEIINILSAETQKPSTELQAAALRTSRRIELSGLVSHAEPFLKNSPEKLTVAALEYIAHFDPERIFPLLGYYLQSGEIRIKSSAVAILKQFDLNQALAMLGTMLRGKNLQQIKGALSCMLRFDFMVVRKQLVDFLQINSDSELLDMGLCLFQSNPDPNCLYDLYVLEKGFSGEFASRVKFTREQLTEELVRFGLLNDVQAGKMENEFAQRFSADQENAKIKAAEAPKPYSLNEIRNQANLEQMQNTFLKKYFLYPLMQLKESFESSSERSEVVPAAGFILVFMMISVYLAFSASSESESKVRSGPLLACETSFLADIYQIDRKKMTMLLVTADGKKILVKSGRYASSGQFLPGDKVKVRVVPFRINPDNVIIVKNYHIEKIR